MMKKLTLVITFLVVFGQMLLGQTLDTIKILHYNILRYGQTSTFCNTDCKDDNLRKIISTLKPDIWTINELGGIEANADRILNNVLKTIQPEKNWQRARYRNPNRQDIVNMLYYNSLKFGLKSEQAIPTGLREINVYTLFYKDPGLSNGADTVFIRVCVQHLKAGSAASDATERTRDATTLMNNLAHMPMVKNTVITGDFNLKGASEGAYQVMTMHTNADIRGYDPLNRPGEWNNNEAFACTHTQSPRMAQESDGGISGGLDDRFDFILCTNAIMNNTNGVGYVQGSYTAVGNNCRCFNRALTECNSNYVLTPALYRMSDHLPVMADFTVRTSVRADRQHSGGRLSIGLYPNPAHQSVTVYGNFTQILLLDLQGLAVFKKVLDTSLINPTLDLSDVSPGLYLVQAQNVQGQTAFARLLVH